ncbi:MAG: M48 family metallopeptidase [Planctomycetota bacterium]
MGGQALDAPDIVNAWCLPGGKMAVYTGLLPLCPDDDSLAAVMGHEIGHAVARHSGERLSQQRLTELGISLTAAAVDERYQADVVAALGVGAQLGIVLPYSREHEYEADEIGLILMVKAGYDPRAAVALWDRMAARAGDRGPEFLSTHPFPEKRARRLQSLIPGILERYSGRPQK